MPDDRSFDHIKFGGRSILRIRIGMLYPADYDQMPRNPQGVLCYSMPGEPLQKFYLPALGKPLNALNEDVAYPIPPDVREAPIWELALNQRPNCTTMFGRFPNDQHPENGAFTFDGRRYIFLQTHRGHEFNPMYIAVVVVSGICEIFRLEAERSEEEIRLHLRTVDKNEVLPPCFVVKPEQPE